MKIMITAGLLLAGQLFAADFEGSLDWNRRLELSTTVSGMISKIYVDSGDRVKQGQLLLELDQRHLKARLLATQMGKKAAQHVLDEAQRELERSMELYDRTMLSEHDHNQAETAVAQALAEVKKAAAKIAKARLRIEYSKITAPFDGRVAAIHAQPKQAVVNRFQATPLLTLIDDSLMKAVVHLGEKQLTSIQTGDQVKVAIRGEWHSGTVASIGLEPVSKDTASSYYAMVVELAPAKMVGLRSGEKVVVRTGE